MTGRLVGPSVALVPVPDDVAAAGDDPPELERLLAALGLRPCTGWPHDDTASTLSGGGSWLVVRDGQVLGECGWKAPPDADGTVEIRYGLARPVRGAGVGTEAVALLVAWTERQPGVRGVAAEALVGNDASRRLLRRLGFVEHAVDGRTVRAERPGRVRGRHVC
ncbi:MAG TPA: GNAT family N-acetyltransferase [Mycobacteriales bacterium]|nr:GNAT family N-acetyltransferase [Mycobacteriales bacterium]